MGEGKSEGGPGVDRGGGRGCQPGPGLSSGSLFLPRVSLGAAGDNVALSGVAGGGGTRRTERYPPGHVPAGAGGIGAAGRASGERVPLGRGGGFLLFSPLSPTPVTSLCHPKVPRRTGGAQLPGCPDASRGRWPVPITGAFGDPASLAHLGGGGGGAPPCPRTPSPCPPPPAIACGSGGDTRGPAASPPAPPPASSFSPRRDLLSPVGHPRGERGPGLAACTCRHRARLRTLRGGGGYGGVHSPPSPPPPPPFQAPLHGEQEYSPSPAFPAFSSPR